MPKPRKPRPSRLAFQKRFLDEATCVRFLFQRRWPEGLRQRKQRDRRRDRRQDALEDSRRKGMIVRKPGRGSCALEDQDLGEVVRGARGQPRAVERALRAANAR